MPPCARADSTYGDDAAGDGDDDDEDDAAGDGDDDDEAAASYQEHKWLPRAQ